MILQRFNIMQLTTDCVSWQSYAKLYYEASKFISNFKNPISSCIEIYYIIKQFLLEQEIYAFIQLLNQKIAGKWALTGLIK